MWLPNVTRVSSFPACHSSRLDTVVLFNGVARKGEVMAPKGLGRATALIVATLLSVGVVAAPAFADPSGYTSPSTVRTGDHFTVVVAGCESSSASVSLTRIGGPSNVPLESDKGQYEYQGRFQVPPGISAGRYELAGTCGDGTGFVVALTVAPHGAPATGLAPAQDGPNIVAVGTVTLVLAALGGVLIRGRRSHSE